MINNELFRHHDGYHGPRDVWRTCSKKWLEHLHLRSHKKSSKVTSQWETCEALHLRDKFWYNMTTFISACCAWFVPVPPNFQVFPSCHRQDFAQILRPRHVRERWAAALDHFLQLLTDHRGSHCRGNSSRWRPSTGRTWRNKGRKQHGKKKTKTNGNLNWSNPSFGESWDSIN